jgi:very-short-patch-repair endonuclease
MKRKIIPYNQKLKPLAKALRQNMTFAEALLWNELKQKKMLGYDFDRQRPIGDFIVDFYCKDLMLAVEVDGITHFSEEAIEEDEVRQSKLESLGVTFLRFDDELVRKDLANVVSEIEGWIEEWEERNSKRRFPGRIYSKKPTPSPSREGSSVKKDLILNKTQLEHKNTDEEK